MKKLFFDIGVFLVVVGGVWGFVGFPFSYSRYITGTGLLFGAFGWLIAPHLESALQREHETMIIDEIPFVKESSILKDEKT